MMHEFKYDENDKSKYKLNDEVYLFVKEDSGKDIKKDVIHKGRIIGISSNCWIDGEEMFKESKYTIKIRLSVDPTPNVKEEHIDFCQNDLVDKVIAAFAKELDPGRKR